MPEQTPLLDPFRDPKVAVLSLVTALACDLPPSGPMMLSPSDTLPLLP